MNMAVVKKGYACSFYRELNGKWLTVSDAPKVLWDSSESHEICWATCSMGKTACNRELLDSIKAVCRINTSHGKYRKSCMKNEATGVKNGLTKFVESANAARHYRKLQRHCFTP